MRVARDCAGQDGRIAASAGTLYAGFCTLARRAPFCPSRGDLRGPMQKLFAASAIALALVSAAGAQSFPSQTIRIIVPFTPGGSNDVVAREIASGLQTRLKQTAVVENRTGGGGTIAYQYVAKATPDGHLMLIAPASFTM